MICLLEQRKTKRRAQDSRELAELVTSGSDDKCWRWAAIAKTDFPQENTTLLRNRFSDKPRPRRTAHSVTPIPSTERHRGHNAGPLCSAAGAGPGPGPVCHSRDPRACPPSCSG